MKRYLFVSLAPECGGHEKMLSHIISEVAKKNSVGVLARVGNPCLELQGIDKFIIKNDSWLGWVRFVFNLLKSERSSTLILSIGYLGELFQILFFSLLFWKRIYIYTPIVVSFRDLGARFAYVQQLTFRLMAFFLMPKWIFLAPDQIRYFRENFYRGAECFAIPNIVDESSITRRDDSFFEQIVSKPIRVVVVGRLDLNQKGLDSLLAYLEMNSEDICLTIVGRGAGEKYILSAIPKLKCRTQFLPWQNISKVFSDNDVLLIPSRFEGVPLVMLEAMFFGIPIVASRIPGHTSYLPAECIFDFGDFNNAFSIVKKFYGREYVNSVIRANKISYDNNCSMRSFIFSVNKIFES